MFEELPSKTWMVRKWKSGWAGLCLRARNNENIWGRNYENIIMKKLVFIDNSQHLYTRYHPKCTFKFCTTIGGRYDCYPCLKEKTLRQKGYFAQELWTLNRSLASQAVWLQSPDSIRQEKKMGKEYEQASQKGRNPNGDICTYEKYH